MCIQDLAIARRTTARPVLNLEQVGASVVRIPGNVRRIGLAVVNVGTNEPVNLSIAPSDSGPYVGSTIESTLGVVPAYGSLTVQRDGGFICQDLYTGGIVADILAWELVPDSELDAAVTLTAANLTR